MTSCAILATASTTQTVRALLQRLVKDVVLDDRASTMPWTIVNKYYTAEVKFIIHTVDSWATAQNDLHAPALLFVWNRGESYRDHVRKIYQYASQYELEVALAVRLPNTGSISSAELEDDQDIDAHLSSMGFEFVDVPDIEASSPDRSGILGIPRIIDALSTIMWPSMVRHTSERVTVGNSGISSDDYHNLVRLVGEKLSGNDSDRLQRELQELDRWLDEGTLSSDVDVPSAGGEDEAVPWSTAVTPGTLSPSSSGFLESSRPSTPKAGFDDDFTSFVSASPPTCAGIHRLSSPQTFPTLTSTSFTSTFSFNTASSGLSTPTFDDDASLDMTRLAPGESYKSLGSVSDFGEPDKDSSNPERLSNNSDDADQDMPSRAEIAKTSRRIFGDTPLSLSSTQERGCAMETLDGAQERGHPGEGVDVEMTDVELEGFDLQNVLGALQALKEEIAGMPDKERRKAAARVALGLAYGLGGNSHSQTSEEPF